MWKFSQLLNYGSDANISFSCVNGRVQVNLIADIGSNRQEHFRSEASGRNFTNGQMRPSKLRCRNRRRAARSKQNLVDVTVDNKLHASEDDAYSDESVPTFDVSVKSDAMPEVASNNVAYADTAVQAAPVAFDATCQSEPYDADLSVNPLTLVQPDLDEPYQCKFCNEEFLSWDHFVEQCQRTTFMCSDCLDFFILKPWFKFSEIIAIDVDDGANLYPSDLVLILDPHLILHC